MPPSPAPSRADRGLEYLDALHECFERALAQAGGVERRLEIAGVAVRLRFAGRALADLLLPPFEHLAGGPDGAGGIEIEVFDSASTGIEPPPPPWQRVEAEPGTSPIERWESDRACLLLATASGALTAADPGAGRAVFHLPAADRIPANERAAPLREALHVLMAPRDRWLAHAGAVGLSGTGVLLVGRGGSGKSTLALSCARAGMEFVADDYLLLETGPALAHAMQSTAKLTADSAARLGIAAAEIDPAGFEPTLEGPAKALVEVDDIAPGLVRRRLRIGALLAPAVAGLARPELEPVSAARGLRALAPSTVLQMHSRGNPALAALGELVREVPSYELRLSPDPAANAAAVAEVVGELA